MDGLEWNTPSVLFLKYAEKLAVYHSDVLIADSLGIQFIWRKYGEGNLHSIWSNCF